LRFLLGAAASMAFQGSLLRWAADHRRHHATSDRSGDLHSPWIDSHGVEIDGARGFFHAHMGWLFDDVVTDLEVHGMNLRKDKLVVFFDNTHWYWASLSLAMPWAYGYLLGGLNAAWGCMIVGGFVRTFLFHHATWSVNSICHMIGGTKFEQHNRSKNNIAVALLTFGEGWHNNHHRFPRSAIHGLNRHEPDPSGFVITVLERMGLVKDVVRIGT
jgi:stearoyl-CoA desaturase (delta-9 desaturase)